jgi:hypothetical protein
LGAPEFRINSSRQRRFDQLRLLLQTGLGHDQILLISRHLGFRPHHLDGRQGSHRHLTLVVRKQSLHVFFEGQVIPVEIQRLGDRGDNLLAEYAA